MAFSAAAGSRWKSRRRSTDSHARGSKGVVVRYAILLLLLGVSSRAEACTCGGTSDFLDGQSIGLVVVGRVVGYITPAEHGRQPVAMDVEVSRVLHGKYRARTI